MSSTVSEATTAYTFEATKGESWTEKKVSFNFAQKLLYRTLTLVVKSKVKADAWKKIEKVDLDSLKTAGKLELFVVEILQMTVEGSDEYKKNLHTKVIAVLKTFPDKGLTGSYSAILSLIKAT